MSYDRPLSFEWWKETFYTELEDDYIEQSVHETWEQFTDEMYRRYVESWE